MDTEHIWIKRKHGSNQIFKKPELKTSVKGSFAYFSIGTVKSYKDGSGEWQNQKSYHNCVAFGKTAEFVANNIKPKDIVRVVTEAKVNEYNGESSLNYVVAQFQVIHRDYSKSQQYADTSVDTGVDDTETGDTPADLPF